MSFEALPREVDRTLVPPVKCQGIKTKLVPFILASIRWEGRGRWIEPFVGSGVVVMNVAPERALLSDTNPHIVRLYQRIGRGDITPNMVTDFLRSEGKKLKERGGEHYYEIRERFNESADSLDFLFLNRSCFNGMMRFNRKGKFNVPFCRKPDRFRQAYVTKIANQVASLARVMHGKQWDFRVSDWRDTLRQSAEGDFVYLDPPYIGRYTDYYGQWSETDAEQLADVSRGLPCGLALSMWKANVYRTNGHLDEHWSWAIERTTSHFYHIGAQESLRHEMEEALMISPGYEAARTHTAPQQLSLFPPRR